MKTNLPDTTQVASDSSEQGTTDQAAKPKTWTPEADRKKPSRPKEIGGREGPEPTRYGDWEKNGRCIDF
ncbi:MAG: DUF1674 domain-containing protein [Pseudomonadota bacterium]